jgi:hypothetical protein
MWARKGQLRREGFLLPLRSGYMHYAAALEMRGVLPAHLERFAGVLDRLVARLNEWDGDAIVSHELFTMASAEQVDALFARLRVAELHIVITARDVARQVPADWQETVKNGYRFDYGRYVDDLVRDDPSTFFWQMQDIPAIAERWCRGVPPERVHVITVPGSGAAPDELWRRFCSVLGVDPDVFRGVERPTNTSMGVAGTEFIRQIPEFVGDGPPITPEFRHPLIKILLAQKIIAQHEDIPIGLQAAHRDWFIEKSVGYVDYIKRHKFDVVGDLDSLISRAEQLPDHVTPTAAQVVDAGITGIIGLIEERAEYEKHLKEELETVNIAIRKARATKRELNRENALLQSIRGGFYALRMAVKRRVLNFVRSRRSGK